MMKALRIGTRGYFPHRTQRKAGGHDQGRRGGAMLQNPQLMTGIDVQAAATGTGGHGAV